MIVLNITTYIVSMAAMFGFGSLSTLYLKRKRK